MEQYYAIYTIYGEMAKWLMHWIPNQGIQKPLGGSRSTQSFIFLRLIKLVPGISGNLVIKSKLLPRSDPSLEAVEPLLFTYLSY